MSDYPTGFSRHGEVQVPDHSSLSTVIDCARKYYYNYELGLEPKEPNLRMLVGSGGHKAMQVLYTEGFGAIDRALDAALSYISGAGVHLPHPSMPWLTNGHISVCLHNYVDAYAKEPYRVVHRIEQPLIRHADDMDDGLGGIPDLIVEDAFGAKPVMDHKFTFSYLGASFYNRQKYSKQGKIYCILASEYYGEPLTAFVVNAIYMGEKASTAGSKAQRFDRFSFEFSAEELREAEDWVRGAKDTIRFYRDDNMPGCGPDESGWPQNGGAHCGWCSFAPLCGASPDLRPDIIERSFGVRQRRGLLLSGADD